MIQTLYNGVKFGLAHKDLDNIERLDLPYLSLIHYMMRTGMQVDPDHFKRMEKVLMVDMDAITEKIREVTGFYINVGSADQVADLLFSKLKIKQLKTKMTPTGKREAVDDEVLKTLQHEHPAVGLVQDYREYDKLRGTYAVPLYKLARRVGHANWRIFPNLKTTRVPSGRNNCDEPNLLAMPNRTERGRELCEGFICPDGWVYLSVDFSQVEPRVAAHRSGDEGLVAVYENDEDIYSDFATAAFRLDDERWECQGFKSIDGDDRECRDSEHKGHGWHYPTVHKKKHRFPAKTCTLASLYEVSGPGLAEQMPVVCKTCDKPSIEHDCGKFVGLWQEDNCQDLINAFYIKYSGLMDMRRKDHQTARQTAMIWDDFGRNLHVTAVRSVLPWVVSAALREAGNLPIQGTARGIVKLGETQVYDELLEMGVVNDICQPVLDVHDELLCCVQERWADEIGSHITNVFENVVKLRVPLKASTAKAQVWGKMPK